MKNCVVVLASIILAVGVTLFAALVWPTPYRYDRTLVITESSPSPGYLVRTNRFTGKSEMLSSFGWKPMEEHMPMWDEQSKK